MRGILTFLSLEELHFGIELVIGGLGSFPL